MKNIFILTFVLIVASLSAQESTKIAQDSVVYLTAEQEAFMIDKETKYLFKTRPLQVEQKLSEAFSINFFFAPELLFGRVLTSTSNETFLSSVYLEAETELRYYYKLPRLIKEGKQANNLSSSYFGFGGRFGKTVYSSDKSFTTASRTSYQLYGAWGEQKRFLNYGYLDYGLELSYQRSKIGINPLGGAGVYNTVNLSTRTNVGFAFGQTYDIKEETKCPIFKCYLDRKSAFKINYNSLLAISVGKNVVSENRNEFFIRINPNIAYEHKIGSTPFSLIQDLDVLVSLTNTKGIDRNDFGVGVYSIDYELGGRYYFHLKSDIKKGKSGNNLAGGYGFLRGSYERFVSEFTFTRPDGPFISKYKNENIRAEFGVGYQKSVLNDLYFDLQFGFRPKLKTYGSAIQETTESFFVSDFKVGKMF